MSANENAAPGDGAAQPATSKNDHDEPTPTGHLLAEWNRRRVPVDLDPERWRERARWFIGPDTLRRLAAIGHTTAAVELARQRGDGRD